MPVFMIFMSIKTCPRRLASSPFHRWGERSLSDLLKLPAIVSDDAGT
jgi:hypothetical protein